MTQTTPTPVNQKIRFWVVRLLFLACVPLILFSSSGWAAGGVMHPILKSVGAVMVVAAVLYRVWAILYIGGRKNSAVIQDGPYSMSRHPLYFGTTVGAFGFGLLLGSLTLSLLLGLLALVVLNATASREERFLRAEFGPDYDAFAQRVRNKIVPATAGFQTPAEVVFVPKILRTNLADALGFMACFPIAEALESVKAAGMLGGFILY